MTLQIPSSFFIALQAAIWNGRKGAHLRCSHSSNLWMRSAFLLLLCIGSLAPALAQYDGGVDDATNEIEFRGTAIAYGASKWHSIPSGPACQVSKKLNNVISLTINEDILELIDDFTVTVSLNIDYGLSASNFTTLANQALTVNYKKGAGITYDPRQYIHFKDAEYVKVTIAGAPVIQGPATALTKLVLISEMQVRRFFQPTGTGLGAASVSFNSSRTPNALHPNVPDELAIQWTALTGQCSNGYQLEWAWLENGLESLYFDDNSVFSVDALFHNNSTRIDLSFLYLSYNIPLFYNGIGKLYYRVRPVHFDGKGNRLDGVWAYPAGPDFGAYSFSGHGNSNAAQDDNPLNWQVRTSFAEDGKRKSVMEYFDGSMRSRQTITKDNTTNVPLVAETFYDGQGRPSVQILPAPGIGSIIKYHQNLNVFNGASASASPNTNPALFFDLKPATGNLSLSALSGASNYYSPDNPHVTSGKNQFIPNAQGYPYTLTRYTPDGTGRVLAQSGVGQSHTLGSGHETKYFYGTPAQEELDGLFGIEVGFRSHYFKNMVQDANGQMSVSYTDMHGRTIATALAGNSPTNLNALNYTNAESYPNQAGTGTIHRNLLSTGVNVIKNNNSIEAINSLLVPAPTSYAFHYTLTPKELELPGCSTPLCYDCLYDLEISVTDESGESPPTVKKYSNVSLAAGSCGPVPLFKNEDGTLESNVITFSLTLQPGSYAVRKTLTINEASLQKFKASHAVNALCESKETLIQQFYTANQSATGCNGTPADACAQCNLDLGTWPAYRCRFLVAIGSDACTNTATIVSPAVEAEILRNYDAAKARCTNLCSNDPQMPATLREMMLQDMVPYTGQYAANPTLSPAQQIQELDATSSMFREYNIFATSSSRPTAFFRQPVGGNYINTYGQPDAIIHADPTKLPNISPDHFTQLFGSRWAEALLPRHPEYQKLLYAEQVLASSYTWINQFSQLTLAQANAAGYFNSPNAIVALDPFYALTDLSGTTFKGNMEAFISITYKQVSNSPNTYATMWQIAYGAVMCRNQPTDQAMVTCFTSGVPPYPSYSGSGLTNFYNLANVSANQKEQIWEAFKGFYRAERTAHLNSLVALRRHLPNSADLVAQKFILHFPEDAAQTTTQYSGNGASSWGWMLTGTNNVPGNIPPSPAVGSQCDGYIQSWRQALLQCPAITSRSDMEAIINDVTAGLKAVCAASTNNLNPQGASNLAGSATVSGPYGPYGSFEEVFQKVLVIHYGINLNTLCNPYLIEFPKPNGLGPKLYNQTISAITDCHCSQFTELKVAMGNMSPTLVEVNTFLSANAAYWGTPLLSATLYSALMGHCTELATRTSSSETNAESNSSSSAPEYVLTNAETLPTYLECGFSGPRCLRCNELSSHADAFRIKFSLPAAAPYFSGSALLSQAEIETNVLFAKYLNYKTGFQYTWIEYAQKAAASPGCNLALANTSATHSVICGSAIPLSSISGFFVPPNPCQQAYNMAVAQGTALYEQKMQTLLAGMEAAYRAKCLAAQNEEVFTVDYTAAEYHYTLYYYDLAGNLVKTVPPRGVRPDFSATFTNAVEAARKAGNYDAPNIHRSHTLTTNYRYNSLGQVRKQHSPDGGVIEYWYDRLGRLTLSQNEKQADHHQYSYTMYDDLGRIQEVGQVTRTGTVNHALTRSQTSLSAWLANGAAEQVTHTVYDRTYFDGYGTLCSTNTLCQENLRNRVSYTTVHTQLSQPGQVQPQQHDAATYYSYDIHGNVHTLLQDYNSGAMVQHGHRFKKIEYNYDLISGKVNAVSYQPGEADAFYHQYSYDAENRLIEVQTSRDKLLWEKDARYDYYQHGPLARTLLGGLKVQGMDYAYTLQGWLKGVNSTAISGEGNAGECAPGTAPDVLPVNSRSQYGTPALYVARQEIRFEDEFVSNLNDEFIAEIDPNFPICTQNAGGAQPYVAGDMGRDGDPSSPGESFKTARDAFGFSLNYFGNDYIPIRSAVRPFAGNMYNLPANGDAMAAGAALYNGNIASMLVSIPKLGSTSGSGILYGYRYDQLNRLVGMNAYRGLNAQNNTFSPANMDDYRERITYDPNGNIKKYERNGTTTGPMATTPALMDDLTYRYGTDDNRLARVEDAVLNTPYTGDIENQSSSNYEYDKIGNLTKDVAGNLNTITWTVYGKIESITKTNGDVISYRYDAAGNRICKTVGSKETWYVRDAQGNVMSVYEAVGSAAPVVAETHLYGSSRLGLCTGPTLVTGTTIKIYTQRRGQKRYELSNHLGNVLVTVSDKKLPVANAANDAVAYFTADVATASDYAPFGMALVGRSYNSGSKYRYGFNGQEHSDDVIEGNYTAEYWQYDSRTGRRWNVDPVVKEFESPYASLGNNPIWLTDPDGRDTTLPSADGKNITLPTGATFTTFQEGTKYKHASNGKEVNVQAGQVSSFTVDGNTYSARFNTETLSFVGYQDDNGKSIVQTNTYGTWLNPSTSGYLNPTNLVGLMYGWDSYTRLNSYIGPMTEAQKLFQAGNLSANSASIRRFFFLQDARSKLSPLGDFISESSFFKGKSLEKAREQAAKALYGNIDEATKASKVFNLRASTTNWAKIGKWGGPALTIATQGYVYYTIIRDKPSLEKLQNDLETPFNPGFWIYRKTVGKIFDSITK